MVGQTFLSARVSTDPMADKNVCPTTLAESRFSLIRSVLPRAGIAIMTLTILLKEGGPRFNRLPGVNLHWCVA